MKTLALLLSALSLLAVPATTQAGGRCGNGGGYGGYGGYGYGGGGYCGPSYGGWGGGWGGWGPSFGINIVTTPTPVYRTVTVYQPVTSNSGTRSSIVAQTQVRLARLGYYDSSIDGEFGPRTSRAIERYQMDNRLPVTGVLDRRTLASLGVFS